MTIQTCLKYYELAKKKGDAEQMDFWRKRAEAKGGVIEEEVIEEVEEKKKGKK